MNPAPAVAGIMWGILWMVLATGFQATASGLVRHLSADIGVFQLLFYYSAISLLIMAPMVTRLPAGSLHRARQKLGLYSGRAILSWLGMLTSFYAYSRLNIADVQALLFTVPIFTILMASLFLNEVVGARGWAAGLIGFAGALLIIRPGFIDLNIGSIAALFSAFALAAANIFIRRLTETESPILVTLAANVVTVPLALIPALSNWQNHDWSLLPWIIAMGCLFAGAQLTLTYSIRAADARIVQIFNFLRLPWAVLVGWVLFAELPDHWTWLGAAVIFAAGIYAIQHETRTQKVPIS
ncbi:MAG: drug/metabolite transporter (DMT)-like permease [Alphaproteobacteria bacterium]|jgi:drug/metabolite transporter (DMT)-like permease